MIVAGVRLDDQPAGAGVRRLVLRGELDVHASQGLRDAIDARVRDGDRAVHLVLDRLDFIDSAGLCALVDVDRDLRAQGRHVVLEHPTRPVRHLLRIAELDGHFEIVPA